MEYIRTMDNGSWIIVLLVSIVLICVFLKRETLIVQQIVLNVILEAERKFNTKEGQLKLEFAANQLKLKVPKALRFFITKRMLVGLIEFVLNKFAHIMKVGVVIDIDGNDDFLMQDMKFDLRNKTPLDSIKNNQRDDSDFSVYGALKTETDWKSDHKTSVELGFKKKL